MFDFSQDLGGNLLYILLILCCFYLPFVDIFPKSCFIKPITISYFCSDHFLLLFTHSLIGIDIDNIISEVIDEFLIGFEYII